MGLRTLLSVTIATCIRVAVAYNASAIYNPTLLARQQHVLGPGEDHFSNAINPETYLKLSVKHELQQRLSEKASVYLDGEEAFSDLDARYTQYKRPQYFAAVKVVEEQDVIETVRS